MNNCSSNLKCMCLTDDYLPSNQSFFFTGARNNKHVNQTECKKKAGVNVRDRFASINLKLCDFKNNITNVAYRFGT